MGSLPLDVVDESTEQAASTDQSYPGLVSSKVKGSKVESDMCDNYYTKPPGISNKVANFLLKNCGFSDLKKMHFQLLKEFPI